MYILFHSSSYNKCEIVNTSENFGRDSNRCSEIANVTIPYSNCSQNIKDSWFILFSTLVPTTNVKSLTPLYRGTANFGRDRDRCSKIGDVTIPYSNCSQSIKDSWFIFFSTLVPTTNAKSLTPLYRGTAKFGRDRSRSSEIADVTIPYSNCSQSIKDSWFVSFPTLVPTTNAKSLTPVYRGTAKFGQDTNRSSRDRKCYHPVFRTPTVLKVLKIVGLSFSPLLFLQQTICSRWSSFFLHFVIGWETNVCFWGQRQEDCRTEISNTTYVKVHCEWLIEFHCVWKECDLLCTQTFVCSFNSVYSTRICPFHWCCICKGTWYICCVHFVHTTVQF